MLMTSIMLIVACVAGYMMYRLHRKEVAAAYLKGVRDTCQVWLLHEEYEARKKGKVEVVTEAPKGATKPRGEN